MSKLKEMLASKKKPKKPARQTSKSKKMISKKSKYLCLDLGSYSLKGIVGGADPSKIRIDTAFEEPVPEGFYQNGRIRDKEEFKKFLTEVLSKNKIKVKDAIVTIDTSELIKREIVLPDVEDMDLEEAISYEIGDYLPIDVDSYVLQPRVMSQYVEDGQKRQKVLVAALPKEIAEMIFFSLREAGLTPAALDIHSNAIEKLFTESYMKGLYQPAGSFAFVDLGHKISNITILENGEYQFNRILRFGGDSIFLSLNASGYSMNEASRAELYETSVTEYMQKMEEDTYNAVNMAMDTTPKTTGILLEHLSSWVEDVEKVIAYYVSRGVSQRVDRIFLYGGSSHFKDLDRFFEKKLGISTVFLDKVEGVTFPSGKDRELFKYINALSALIRR